MHLDVCRTKLQGAVSENEKFMGLFENVMQVQS